MTSVALLMGLGGEITSPGIPYMAQKIQAHGFVAKVYSWDQWREAGEWLKSQPGKKAVLGYSNGGSEVTGVTDLGFELDLVISLDPTIWLSMSPLHRNVKEAVCFHNANWLSSFPPVGHARLSTASDFKGKITTIDTYDSHMRVDTDASIQAYCEAKIFALGAVPKVATPTGGKT
jgi:dienelactone hydrolase